MKKWFGLLLFGIALLIFATASAVVDLNADTNAFAVLFLVFSVLGLVVSLVGVVLIFLEDRKNK